VERFSSVSTDTALLSLSDIYTSFPLYSKKF
jgi:hypothetical protein